MTYPPPYGYPPFRPPAPTHQTATTAMILGILGLVGGFSCFLPLVLSPVAWVLGYKSMKEIDQSGGALGGRGIAQARFITGIIGTVILALGIVAIVVFVILGLNGVFDEPGGTGHTYSLS